MKIYKAKDYDELSRKAASIIASQVLMKPECVLGLATGSTPIGTYKQLIEWYNKGDLDFSGVKSVNLDEYRGLTRVSIMVPATISPFLSLWIYCLTSSLLLSPLSSSVNTGV